MSAFGRNSLALSSGRSSSFLTYEPYYGLTEKPFSLAADPRFLYKSPSHAATFDDLLLGIHRREGLIVLTGDIGTGKTTLCRAVLDRLDRQTFSTFVPDPFVSREDLLKMLLIDFGVMSIDDLKSGRLSGATRADLSYLLYEFLKSLPPLQAFAVLIIDEAQNLPVPLLEEIRILSDLEAPEKLLQVVLVGQLELRSKLKLPEMRQVDQRVSVRCDLEALTRDGVEGYITYRLGVAGGGSDRVRFSPDAIDAIHAASGGVPRVINLICDRVLYRGYLGRKAIIDSERVSLAVGDLGVGALTALDRTAFDKGESGMGAQEKVCVPEKVGAPAKVSAPEKKESPLSREGMDDVGVKSRRGMKSRHEDHHLDFEGLDRDDLAPGQPLSALDFSFEEDDLAGKWRRQISRWAKFAAIPAALLFVLLAFAQVGRVYLAPWLSSETSQSPKLTTKPGLLKPLNLPGPPKAAPGTAVASPEPPAAAPVAPAGSAGRPYAIGVAMFQSTQRADRLVAQLTAANYSAYQVQMNLGARGRAYAVMVGAYAAPADAEADLARILQIPGHADARIVTAPAKSLPQ